MKREPCGSRWAKLLGLSRPALLHRYDFRLIKYGKFWRFAGIFFCVYQTSVTCTAIRQS